MKKDCKQCGEPLLDPIHCDETEMLKQLPAAKDRGIFADLEDPEFVK